jgi:hypothetical protein
MYLPRWLVQLRNDNAKYAYRVLMAYGGAIARRFSPRRTIVQLPCYLKEANCSGELSDRIFLYDGIG